MWLLAIKAMLADRGKLITSLLGITFSVVLVNLQGGLLVGLIRKASVLVDYGEADIWVGHREMTNVDLSPPIPERWVDRIRRIEGVERADRYVIGDGPRHPPVREAGAGVRDRHRSGEPPGQPCLHRGGQSGCRPWTRRRADRRQRGGSPGELSRWRPSGNQRPPGPCCRHDRDMSGFTTTPYVFTTLERCGASTSPGSGPASARTSWSGRSPAPTSPGCVAKSAGRSPTWTSMTGPLTAACAWNTG